MCLISFWISTNKESSLPVRHEKKLSNQFFDYKSHNPWHTQNKYFLKEPSMNNKLSSSSFTNWVIKFWLINYLYYLSQLCSTYIYLLHVKLCCLTKVILLRPYSHETFLYTILRYCDKKIFWFQSIDFYWTLDIHGLKYLFIAILRVKMSRVNKDKLFLLTKVICLSLIHTRPFCTQYCDKKILKNILLAMNVNSSR